MPSYRHALRRAVAVATVAVAGLATGAPAEASDASLRKVIKQQERKADPVAERFADDTDDLVSAVGREDARLALKELTSAVKRLRTTVAKETATTARVKRGRTQYLDATDDFSAGLKTFGRGLVAFDPDAPSAAKQLFAKAAMQFKSSGTRIDRAKKLVGGLG